MMTKGCLRRHDPTCDLGGLGDNITIYLHFHLLFQLGFKKVNFTIFSLLKQDENK